MISLLATVSAVYALTAPKDPAEERAERDFALILPSLTSIPRRDWILKQMGSKESPWFVLENKKNRDFGITISYDERTKLPISFSILYPIMKDALEAFEALRKDPLWKQRSAGRIPKPILQLLGLGQFDSFRTRVVEHAFGHSNGKPEYFVNYRHTPVISGLELAGIWFDASFDPLGRVAQIGLLGPFQPIRAFRKMLPKERVQAASESAFWLAAIEAEGFRELKQELVWQIQEPDAAMQLNTGLYYVDAKGFAIGRCSHLISLNPTVSSAVVDDFYPSPGLEMPALTPQHATQLAGKVLMRGATLVRLADAKKFVAPERWEQFAKLAEGQPKNKVMILDRGKKLCLIGRLDPDGEGIQVTIASKDYHWIVKPEWFEPTPR
ncbi:MAG: hypothetical protein JST35_06605 [Armatimonadetes bacterium]|nr:hypothetical protein [Armatimonadota bacterium]